MFMGTKMKDFLKYLLTLILLNPLVFSQGGLTLKNDNAQVEEDGSISISVLENDNIKDKSNLIMEIVEDPKFGTAEIKGQNIVYTPNPNANGVDVFKYKADVGTASGTVQVKVNVKPVNDVPEGITINTNSVPENKPEGTLIGKLKALDPDEKDTFKFALARDNKDNFKIDGSNLLTKRPFDFEEENSFTLSIQISDSGDESAVGTLIIKVENVNESPVLNVEKDLKVFHHEDGGKIIVALKASDPDVDQSGIKYKLTQSPDKAVLKITRSGDLSFLKEPDFEKPVDKNKDNVYEVKYKAMDSKDSKLSVSGSVTVRVKDAIETEVKTLDKRKFVAWTIDHQPYHILMEDAILDYIKMKYVGDESDGAGIDEGNGDMIRELKPTDQIIIVQKKGNNSEIHEIWYGNGLDYTVIDRERVDWIFSQDIQNVLVDRDQYLTSDSETAFHESESERLMAGYGSQFSVWHANNFKMSLSSFSMRSNLIQYASNMRVGNALIGLPGKLSGSSEMGVATQRSEFGFRVPFTFDLGAGNYDEVDIPTAEYLGLYAKGNIENLFSTKTDFHGLIGFTFYPPSSGEKLLSLNMLEPDTAKIQTVIDSTENINILDSYGLVAATVQVPVKMPFFGRLTAAPGYHYIKVAHRLKDKRKKAIKNGQEMYERTFSDDETDLNEGNSYTRLNSFYIRFDLLGHIGQKPNIIEKLSFLDFIQLSKVPFYELSLQYISSLNMILTLNLNVSDNFGVSLTSLSKNSSLKGNWMPDSNFWFGLNYRANF